MRDRQHKVVCNVHDTERLCLLWLRLVGRSNKHCAGCPLLHRRIQVVFLLLLPNHATTTRTRTTPGATTSAAASCSSRWFPYNRSLHGRHTLFNLAAFLCKEGGGSRWSTTMLGRISGSSSSSRSGSSPLLARFQLHGAAACCALP